ncbi:hypothetical protein Tco_0899159 [Tanacetum coccineum]
MYARVSSSSLHLNDCDKVERTKSRPIGYFQALFSCIEVLLAYLNVKILALHSAKKLDPCGPRSLGLKRFLMLKEYRKNYQLIVFHGTLILYKTVQKPETSKEE